MSINIIAHRGASALAKQENTIEAFQIAIDIKADYAEFDIRRTKDGELVVFHDDNINGTLLCELTYEELNNEAGKAAYTVPLLEDVLRICQGKIKLDVELKESGYEKDVVKLINKYFSYDEYMIKSFVDLAIANVKKYDSKIKTGLLVGKSKGDAKRRYNEYFPERRLKQCKADFVSPNYKFATREFIWRMRHRNLDIYVWTVNSPKQIKKLAKKNITGIITDIPDVAISIVNSINE